MYLYNSGKQATLKLYHVIVIFDLARVVQDCGQIYTSI